MLREWTFVVRDGQGMFLCKAPIYQSVAASEALHLALHQAEACRHLIGGEIFVASDCPDFSKDELRDADGFELAITLPGRSALAA